MVRYYFILRIIYLVENIEGLSQLVPILYDRSGSLSAMLFRNYIGPELWIEPELYGSYRSGTT